MITDDTFEQDFTVTLSDEALENAFRLREETPEWSELSLRLYLDGKGCDGFFYGMSFDKEEKEDLVCEFSQNKKPLRVVTDPKTFEFVQGSHIIWSSHEGQEGFLVENPKHKRFRGKFYLRGFWKKKLGASS